MFREKPVKLVALQFHPDDLVFIIAVLSKRAEFLDLVADPNDPEINLSFLDERLEESERCREIARALALAAQ